MFRSGTHVLNEELGRHRRREERKECKTIILLIQNLVILTF